MGRLRKKEEDRHLFVMHEACENNFTFSYSLSICSTSRDVETISHLVIIHCPYAQHLWKDLEKLTGMENIWKGTSVEECIRAWFQKGIKSF
jgi:hypothetical protein